MGEKEKKRQVAKIATFITSIFVIFLSISYAFINQTLTGTKRQVIVAGNLQLDLKEGDEITIENMLPMYDEVGMLQKEFTFTLTNKTPENTNYTLKLKDVTGEDKEKIESSYIRYGIVKDDFQNIDFLSNSTDNIIDVGVIEGNQIIKYSLRLWIDSNVEDESLVKGKTLSYKIEVSATLDTSVAEAGEPVSEKAFTEEFLGESCKTYDDGVDTFLVGQCQNNYVWYSGKLWRVVLKNNETGAVKMVTDNDITAISYNANGNTVFEDSYMDQWLTQEFLPTLHDYQDYLVVDSAWDATQDNSSTPSRPVGTTTVPRTVGLLNLYEYYTIYNNSDGLATYENGYLNNGTYWWLITLYGSSNVRYVSGSGSPTSNTPSHSYGVRPSVNLQSAIRITSGNGSQSEPYKLEGDNQETVNGTTLLSTRYSGEYVTFNNELYRIVGVENGKTKITAVDKPTLLSSNQFHSTDEITSFVNASIKTDLETYYQNDITEPYKAMVETNMSWYLGTVESGASYKASICKIIDAKISTSSCERTDTSTTASVGLPRAGEMFTSQITRGAKATFWALTPYSSSLIGCVRNSGTLSNSNSSNGYGVRPSLYLKPTVRMASTNEGDGTYEHPYDIELGE